MEVFLGTTARNNRRVLHVAIIVAFAVLAGVYFAALAIDCTMLDRLEREDGLIETAGAIFFLAAAVGFFALCLFRLKGGRKALRGDFRFTLVFGLLAMLMFVCFGEEISWGQRVFGWNTPGLISDLNAQNEVNLHNLHWVHQWNPDGSEKGFVGKLVNMNRLFSIFWLVVFVLLPVTARLSERARRFLENVGMVVPPLWTGCLFLTSYAVYKVVLFLHAGSIRADALDEIKETSYAAIYAFIALVAVVAEIKYRVRPNS
ncbi:MAG: hypothetical protein K8R59_02595 [Thermoanaerobaculales bacterium]|nr:hypothetical protein [Thermoanaerobaculales bacterium]